MDYLDILKEKCLKLGMSDEQAEVFSKFFVDQADNSFELHDMLLDLVSGKQSLKFQGLACKVENDNVVFELGLHVFSLSFELAKDFLIAMIGILEPIQPLGTVVDLKAEYVAGMTEHPVDNYRVIIIERFVYLKELEAYFEYVGVAYPIGRIRKDAVIQFTPRMIDKVVHAGFSDLQEEAFVKLLKAEMIVEQGYTSMAFIDKDKHSSFQKSVREGACNE